MNPTFILTKHTSTVRLITDWGGPQGPSYDRHSVLPHMKRMRAGEFVTRSLLGQVGLPRLSSDPPEKLVEHAWSFISHGMAPEILQFAALYYDLRSKGVDLPSVTFGPSLSAQGLDL